MGVTKKQVAEAMEAVMSELPTVMNPSEISSVAAAVRYAMSCTAGRASFSQSRPVVPTVMLRDGNGQPSIKVVEGMAIASVIHYFMSAEYMLSHLVGYQKDVVAAVQKAVPGLERKVAERCQALLRDEAAVRRKRDQLAEEDRRHRASRRARFVRECKSLLSEGWEEDDVTECFREATVIFVTES